VGRLSRSQTISRWTAGITTFVIVSHTERAESTKVWKTSPTFTPNSSRSRSSMATMAASSVLRPLSRAMFWTVAMKLRTSNTAALKASTIALAPSTRLWKKFAAWSPKTSRSRISIAARAASTAFSPWVWAMLRAISWKARNSKSTRAAAS
jgi:hypothetical protein